MFGRIGQQIIEFFVDFGENVFTQTMRPDIAAADLHLKRPHCLYAPPRPTTAIAAMNATAKAVRASRFSCHELFGSFIVTA